MANLPENLDFNVNLSLIFCCSKKSVFFISDKIQERLAVGEPPWKDNLFNEKLLTSVETEKLIISLKN